MEESTPASDPEEGVPTSSEGAGTSPSSPPPPPASDPVPGAAELLTLGLTVAVTIVVGGAIGYLVDRWLGTSPIFTLIGLVLGIVAAVFTAVSTVRKYL
jgi:Putative F0F1-ATPase subunit Ca2+/Mg2+ transporter